MQERVAARVYAFGGLGVSPSLRGERGLRRQSHTKQRGASLPRPVEVCMRWPWRGVGLALVLWLGVGVATSPDDREWLLRQRAAVQLRSVRIALEAYRDERGDFPGLHVPGDQTHAALYHALLREGGWRGAFLYWDDTYTGVDSAGRPVLLDPWGQPIHYRVDGSGYDLVSGGPDGRNAYGGSGDDLGFWGDSPELRGLPVQRRVVWIATPALALLLWGLLTLGRWVWAVTRPRPPLVLHLEARVERAGRCAWCHDHAPRGSLRACDGCGVTLHGDCWELATVCTTLGCRRPAQQVARYPLEAATRSA